MSRSRSFALLVLLTLLLAGCSGKNGGNSSAGTGDDEVVATLAAPTWAVGDWWNFTTPAGGATLVVTGEQTQDWIVETDNAGMAFYDARTDISNMGAVGKSNLQGSQGDQRVKYFEWPLTDGDTWEMALDGQTLDVTAHDTGDGPWHFEGRNATGLYVSYLYDPEVEWFSLITFYAPDGSEQYVMEINDFGGNYTGSVDRWTLDEVFAGSGDLASADSSTANFAVPLGVTDVWVGMHVVCATGSALIGVAPFPVLQATLGVDDRGAGTEPPCPLEAHFEGSAGRPEAPPQGGDAETWTYGVLATPDATGTYSLEILTRTLETVAPFAT